MKNKTMDKIEKLELEYDDWKRGLSLGSREIHIIIGVVLKVNEIIDILNSRLFEPTITVPNKDKRKLESEHVKTHRRFLESPEKQSRVKFNSTTPDGIKEFYRRESESVRRNNEKAKSLLMGQSEKEKQEEWKEEDWKLDIRTCLLFDNKTQSLGMIMSHEQIRDLEHFISQLLSEEFEKGVIKGRLEALPITKQLLSEKTFNREECELILDGLETKIDEFHGVIDLTEYEKVREKISKLLNEKE